MSEYQWSRLRQWATVWLLAVCPAVAAVAQHEHANHGSAVERPTIFLDKSPRVVEYQLKRLSNEQLLLVETATDDKRYIPVFSAILSREGMSAANRATALEGLVAINRSNPIVELVKALQGIAGKDEAAARVRQTLSNLVLNSPPEMLSQQQVALHELTDSSDPALAATGLAALIAAGEAPQAFELARSKHLMEALFHGIASIPSADMRATLHADTLAATTADQPESVRQAAIAALAAIPSQPEKTFLRVAETVQDPALRDAAVKTLLTIPAEHQQPAVSREMVAWLVNYAEATPAAERTTDGFVDAMELVDRLMSHVPAEEANAFRARLRETVVRVVRIRTVEEEMRYDLPYFAVEAGRPVQVVLINRRPDAAQLGDHPAGSLEGSRRTRTGHRSKRWPERQAVCPPQRQGAVCNADGQCP